MPDIMFHSVAALFFCIVCNMQTACFWGPSHPSYAMSGWKQIKFSKAQSLNLFHVFKEFTSLRCWQKWRSRSGVSWLLVQSNRLRWLVVYFVRCLQ